MIGAIAGDIIGSVFERRTGRIKTTDFPLFCSRSTFTDDTVLTIASAEAILTDRNYARAYRQFARQYPHAGYGPGFGRWFAADDSGPYGSFGNGSAMRVSPIAWAFDSVEEVLAEAHRSAEVTHNHPEGIKGAQTVAMAVFLARNGESKDAIRSEVESRFAYDLSRSVAEIRPGYKFDSSCQGSVPEAILCFLEADNFEQAVRNAVSLGGDSDTLACIAGGIAQAFFKVVPENIVRHVRSLLPPDLLAVLGRFEAAFPASRPQ